MQNYNIGDSVRTKINFANDKRDEVVAIIRGIELQDQSNNIIYKIWFEADEYSKEQGSTGAIGYITQDDIIEVIKYKPIILLGKNDVVEYFADEALKIDMKKDIAYYPSITTHHTELQKYIDLAKKEKPLVITTQNLEMLDTFLTSDLDFDIIVFSFTE